VTYRVIITLQAIEDLFEIYKYIFFNDGISKADKLFSELKMKCLSLNLLPNRGHKLPELKKINIKSFLEKHYKSYRIIYKIVERTVFINSVLDGRRSLDDLLHQRLVR
jgi:toxin ParE1/3/4